MITSRDARSACFKKPPRRHVMSSFVAFQETVNPCLQTGAWGPRKEGVGEGLAEKVGKGLAKGWRRVGKGLADFLAPSNFGIPEAPV